MDFGTLKSRILGIIGRAPNDLCYELTTADINQRLRLSVMEATTTLVEAASVTLPDDFASVLSVYRDTDPRVALSAATPHTIDRTHVTSGTPTAFAIVDDAGTKKMILNPAPNGSENLELRYFAKLADLSADSDTNDILANYPSVYVYGVLAHHSALIRDMQAANGYAAAFTDALAAARASDVKDRHSGSTIKPRVNSTP